MGFFEREVRKMTTDHHRRNGFGRGHHGQTGYNDRGTTDCRPTRSASVAAPPITCDACGAANIRETRFCQQCGVDITVPVCPECGSDLPAGAQFCNTCGKRQ